MTTLADVGDVHPEAFVTVKLYVAGESPVIVVLAPDPVTVPGLIVQFPEGKLSRTTLPVDKAQVGWVIVPAIGVAGSVFTFKV
jgi:hypothetical protein